MIVSDAQHDLFGVSPCELEAAEPQLGDRHDLGSGNLDGPLLAGELLAVDPRLERADGDAHQRRCLCHRVRWHGARVGRSGCIACMTPPNVPRMREGACSAAAAASAPSRALATCIVGLSYAATTRLLAELLSQV
jgi:hypothetical protein